MDNQPEVVTSDNNIPNETPGNTPPDKPNNTRIVKFGNTTVEITHHYNGSYTYEDVVKNAIKREAENC